MLIFRSYTDPAPLKNRPAYCVLLLFLFSVCVRACVPAPPPRVLTSESFAIFLIDNPEIFKSGAAGMYVLFGGFAARY